MTQEELSASFYYLCEEAYKINIIEKMFNSIPKETNLNIKETCLMMQLILNLSLLPTFEKNNLQRLIDTLRSLNSANFPMIINIYEELKVKVLKSKLKEEIENLISTMSNSNNILNTNLANWFQRKVEQGSSPFNIACYFFEFFTLPNNIIKCDFDYEMIFEALKKTDNPSFMPDGFFR